ncbi:hypothetical protein A5893_01605 [Pedobacter psychrophilus]|uniref:DUF2752 domain-containing protein n=1 Tax=Pedobacter psychrophilus TaxID=1826909 RepID=A0A179DMT7_9SPHI|nr:DUF2752 domain-containing protein [Pedobacter psychrophilus]OAQ41839.1 hypothetical protein A5893_01605 [Pedobacter psychrophilus]
MSGFLLPCLFKKITNLDCPGCGFQRSVLSLFEGDFLESWQLYPPMSLIIITSLIYLLDITGLLQMNNFLKRWILPFNLFLIGINYMIKILLMIMN